MHLQSFYLFLHSLTKLQKNAEMERNRKLLKCRLHKGCRLEPLVIRYTDAQFAFVYAAIILLLLGLNSSSGP